MLMWSMNYKILIGWWEIAGFLKYWKCNFCHMFGLNKVISFYSTLLTMFAFTKNVRCSPLLWCYQSDLHMLMNEEQFICKVCS